MRSVLCGWGMSIFLDRLEDRLGQSLFFIQMPWDEWRRLDGCFISIITAEPWPVCYQSWSDFLRPKHHWPLAYCTPTIGSLQSICHCCRALLHHGVLALSLFVPCRRFYPSYNVLAMLWFAWLCCVSSSAQWQVNAKLRWGQNWCYSNSLSSSGFRFLYSILNVLLNIWKKYWLAKK